MASKNNGHRSDLFKQVFGDVQFDTEGGFKYVENAEKSAVAAFLERLLCILEKVGDDHSRIQVLLKELHAVENNRAKAYHAICNLIRKELERRGLMEPRPEAIAQQRDFFVAPQWAHQEASQERRLIGDEVKALRRAFEK